MTTVEQVEALQTFCLILETQIDVVGGHTEGIAPTDRGQSRSLSLEFGQIEGFEPPIFRLRVTFSPAKVPSEKLLRPFDLFSGFVKVVDSPRQIFPHHFELIHDSRLRRLLSTDEAISWFDEFVIGWQPGLKHPLDGTEWLSPAK